MKKIIVTISLFFIGIFINFVIMAEISRPPSIHRLFVTITTPPDVWIKIMNIKPKYHHGILLKDGSYRLAIGKDGYETVKKEITIKNKDRKISITLQKKWRYVKLDHRGESLPNDASLWQCVKDKQTSLVWEVKTKDKGLYDWNKKYNWQRASKIYPDEVNSNQLCGYNNWRLPKISELRELVYCSNKTPAKEAWKYYCSAKNDKNGFTYSRPTIDHKAFPNTQPSKYWSNSPVIANSIEAWITNFDTGFTGWNNQDLKAPVRLVSD